MQSIRRHIRPSYLFIAILFVVGFIFVLAELDEIIIAIKKADWRAIPGALLFTFVSYTAMSTSFAMISRLFIKNVSLRVLGEIGYVTNVLNHLVTSGGVAGLSLRFILLGRHDVPIRDTVASTMMNFYFGTIDMMVMLPVGLLYLVRNAQIATGITAILQITILLLIVVIFIATFIIFSPTWRHRVLEITTLLASKITRRDLRSTFKQYDRSMNRGIALMRRRPIWVITALFLTICDWFASVGVLSFCLDAFGPRQPFGVVMTGFVIGITLGLASLVPGGIGVQESSMTFVFHLLGVPIGQAIMGSILFRGIFFVLPYLISLAFYRTLLRSEGSTSSV